MLSFLQNKKIKILAVVLSIVFYCLSIISVVFGNNFNFRWPAFYFHLISLVPILLVVLAEKKNWQFSFRQFSIKDQFSFIAIVVLIILCNFLYLTIYPFVSISDEMRDGGLFTFKIFQGQILNIFSYGSYEAHGLIIPTLTSFFYPFFGGSVLTYRVPAALLCSLDVVLIFFLLSLFLNRESALLGAMVLLTQPLHLFFARTQVVVAFNFFWAAVILVVLYFFFKRQNTLRYIFLGIILGFVSQFHAAVRSLSVIILFLILLLTIKEIFVRLLHKEKINRHCCNILFFLLFFIVGFGPMILFSTLKLFFHTERYFSHDASSRPKLTDISKLETLKENYLKSLMVWFYEPTSFFYQDRKPIFSPLLSIFFVLGIGYSLLILRNRFLNILFVLVLCLPFFNSAITDYVNADHRVSPFLTVGSVFFAIGVDWFLRHFPKAVKYFGVILISTTMLYQALNFYWNRPADKPWELKDYLLMHSYYFIQKGMRGSSNVCYLASPTFFTYLDNNNGVNEQLEYFLPNVNVQFNSSNSLKDNEIYLTNSNCHENIQNPNNIFVVPCSSGNTFLCPLNYKTDLKIYY